MAVVKGKITVTVTVEGGELMCWEGKGSDWTKQDEQYFHEGNDVQEWFDGDPEFKQLIDQGATFSVIFRDVVVDYDPPCDDSHGFDPGGAWLVCNGDYVISEVQHV